MHILPKKFVHYPKLQTTLTSVTLQPKYLILPVLFQCQQSKAKQKKNFLCLLFLPWTKTLLPRHEAKKASKSASPGNCVSFRKAAQVVHSSAHTHTQLVDKISKSNKNQRVLVPIYPPNETGGALH